MEKSVLAKLFAIPVHDKDTYHGAEQCTRIGRALRHASMDERVQLL